MSFEVRPCGDLAEFDARVHVDRRSTSATSPTPSAPSASRACSRSSACTLRGRTARSSAARARFPFEMSVPGGAVALRRHDRRRCRADASPARRAARDDARAPRRRARTRRADRGAVGVRGDDLRPLRLRPRGVRGRGRIPQEYVDYVAPRERDGTDPDRRARRGAREVPAALGGARARAARESSSARATGGSCARSRDPPERRGGAGPKRFALLERDGEPVGVRDLPPQDGLGRRRVERQGDRSSRRSRATRRRSRTSGATCSTSTGSRRSRRRCCRRTTRCSSSSRRRGGCGTGSGDGLWVRLLDVGAALSGRTYPEDGELVLRRARRVLPVERRAVAPRRRRRRAHGRRRGSRARRDGARRPRTSEASASRSSRRAAASRS